MIEYIFRPIDKWPRALTKTRRKTSPFYVRRHVPSTQPGGSGYFTKADVPFDKVVRELAAEVERHGARRVVIQLALEGDDIRRDGLPRSTARPDHPGVIVSFETKHGPVRMPCDAFADWKDNLRAISKTLEHLRGVDRYGVSQHGEQYRGWTALPPGPGGVAQMTGTEAADFLAKHVEFVPASWILEKKEAFLTAYKIAAVKLHPDKEGGDAEQFKELQTAADILRRHHGVTE